MLSARADSTVIRTIFGLPAASDRMHKDPATKAIASRLASPWRHMKSVYLSAYLVSRVVQWIHPTNEPSGSP